jgi:hypothetical protein
MFFMLGCNELFRSPRSQTNVINMNTLLLLPLLPPLLLVVVLLPLLLGAPAAQWLRHYATNRKVAGSIPDEVGF